MHDGDLGAVGPVEEAAQGARAAEQGVVAFHFPGLDGGLVEGEGPEGAAEEEEEGEEGEGVGCHEEEEVD